MPIVPFEDGRETPDEKERREAFERMQALENARPLLKKLWDYFQDKKEANPLLALGAIILMSVLILVLSVVGLLNAVPK